MAKLGDHHHLITFFFFFLSSVLYTLCYVSSSSSSPCLQQKQTPLFIFGDSLSYSGNNNYLNNNAPKVNYNPYGMTFFKYASGRFCDGRLVPDFIAEYAEIPLIPPYLQPGYHRFSDGANFASGGAGTLLETNHGMVVPLQTQLKYFKNVKKQLKKKHGDEEAKSLISRAVYMMNVGSNDYIFAPNSSRIESNPQPFVGMVIGNLTAAIKAVYEKGGRKFWVPNLALLQSTKLAKLHHQELMKMLKKLETQLEGFKYSTNDFFGFLVDMIIFPSRYGLTEAVKPCWRPNNKVGNNLEICKSPSDYVFFDGVHPTEAVNQKFASIVWNGSNSPPNMALQPQRAI